MKIILIVSIVIILSYVLWFANKSEKYINKVYLTSPLVQREFNRWKLIKEDVSGSNKWKRLDSNEIFGTESAFVEQWLKWVRKNSNYKFVIIPYMPTKYSNSRHVYSEMYAYIWVSEKGTDAINDNSENKMYTIVRKM
jgi:hypothetical protein